MTLFITVQYLKHSGVKFKQSLMTLFITVQYLKTGLLWFPAHSNVTCIGKGVNIDPTNQ